MRATLRHGPRLGVRRTLVAFLALFICSLLPLVAAAEQSGGAPVAAAFVYPVGDELDYTKSAPGEVAGFYVSDPYLAVRKSRKHNRVHYGTDFANGRGGYTVRAVGAGVVEVSEANALVKVKKVQRLKLPVVVDGKRTYRWSTRTRIVNKWRTGWGNRVVIRHTLPSGQSVYSLYAHLMPRSVIVKQGEVVAAGQPIGRVGRTGRATAAHLHFEIRQTNVGPETDISDPDDEESDEQLTQTVLPHTMDPAVFLADHVVRFQDLEPGTWQARYAMAALKDGLLAGFEDQFKPDRSMTREAFYRALVSAFHLGTPFTTDTFASNVDALVDTGILDENMRSRQRDDDDLNHSEALELMLRCLDHGAAKGRSLARIPLDLLCHDFNRQFAGDEAASTADLMARRLAANETVKRQKELTASAAKQAKLAKARGKPVSVKTPKVSPVKPVPLLDPGFESLAQSKKPLSRAEACLLLASALRMSPAKLSALERAAARVASSG